MFIPSIIIDSHPASDDTPILSVVSPPAAAAAAREQHYSSELHFTTGTGWSSAATGDTHLPCSFLAWTVWISCTLFVLLCLQFLNLFFHFSVNTTLITMTIPFFSSTLPLCMLHIPAWILVLGQWSKSSYHVSSTQRRAPILPLSGIMPLCSAGTLQRMKQICVGGCMWVKCEAFSSHLLIRFLFLEVCVHSWGQYLQ